MILNYWWTSLSSNIRSPRARNRSFLTSNVEQGEETLIIQSVRSLHTFSRTFDNNIPHLCARKLLCIACTDIERFEQSVLPSFDCLSHTDASSEMSYFTDWLSIASHLRPFTIQHRTTWTCRLIRGTMLVSYYQQGPVANWHGRHQVCHIFH